MKIACEACGAKYTIADDKVRGRKVKIRCKGCGTPIVVDGQHGGGANLSEADADAALDGEAPVVWSVNLSDTDSRTMSVEEIVQGYASGVVTADAFVWKDGMADWVAILESEIAPLLAGGAENLPSLPAPEPDAPGAVEPMAAAPGGFPLGANNPRATMPLFSAPNQATAATRPAATRAQVQPDNTQDLFGGIDAAGAEEEEEVATSAPIIPQAGASAYGDGNMTGARNENSVLFSLDALKAGFSPSAPAAKPAPKAPTAGGRPQQPSNPDDPFGMGANAGLMGVGGGGALFGGNNQALLTAPAPPPPPAPPSPAQLAAGFVPMAAARPNNKLVLIVGAIGGVVIIGLILALVLGQKHDETPSAEGSASPSASAAPMAEIKKDEPPASKPDETAAASASAAPPASASAAPETKTTDKTPTAVGATKTATADATKTTTTDATKKKEDPIPPGPSDAPPFSKSSAISALTAASMSAAVCKKPGGPTGSGKATVTFAPSGRVTTATVSGAFAGTPVGGCIASGFRKAHVPPFSGSAVTVSKSFTIN
jgi:predicted Zn finger-like uncharacterized protein